jgi:hypothetical protein
MKTAGLVALAAGILMLIGAMRAFADPSLNNGDDLVVCCASLNSPAGDTAMLAAAPRVRGLDCVAIDGSAKSINACRGAVLGCAENAFGCITDKAGQRNCFCSDPLVGAFTPPKQ